MLGVGQHFVNMGMENSLTREKRTVIIKIIWAMELQWEHQALFLKIFGNLYRMKSRNALHTNRMEDYYETLYKAGYHAYGRGR